MESGGRQKMWGGVGGAGADARLQWLCESSCQLLAVSPEDGANDCLTLHTGAALVSEPGKNWVFRKN